MIRGARRTDNEALHFVLSHNLDFQRTLDLVVVLESTAAGGHDAEIRGPRAIDDLVLELQFAEEFNALVNARRLEFQEIQAAAELLGGWVA